MPPGRKGLGAAWWVSELQRQSELAHYRGPNLRGKALECLGHSRSRVHDGVENHLRHAGATVREDILDHFGGRARHRPGAGNFGEVEKDSQADIERLGLAAGRL